MATNDKVPAHAREYREQGFTVARGFFTKQQARELLAEVERCARADAGPTELTDGGIVYTGGIFMRSESTRKLLADQRVIDFIKPIAGPNLWITMDQAVTKHPGAGVFRWHQDNGYNKLKTEHFQVWIALTKTRLKNGALTLAPGSHKRGLLPHKFMGAGQMEVDAEIGETVSIDADEGDLIIFSSLMLHCTGPNEADSTRVAYVAEYMPLHEFAPDLKAPFFVAAEAGKSNPHFVQSQLGARSVKNQLMYLGPRLSKTAKNALRPVRDVFTGKRAG
jgi:ectoine hydroxylase-related dioxygenase (phytanoyl-CoA dioxygenase family)